MDTPSPHRELGRCYPTGASRRFALFCFGAVVAMCGADRFRCGAGHSGALSQRLRCRDHFRAAAPWFSCLTQQRRSLFRLGLVGHSRVIPTQLTHITGFRCLMAMSMAPYVCAGLAALFFCRCAMRVSWPHSALHTPMRTALSNGLFLFAPPVCAGHHRPAHPWAVPLHGSIWRVTRLRLWSM
jgi:hypothetical protein